MTTPGNEMTSNETTVTKQVEAMEEAMQKNHSPESEKKEEEEHFTSLNETTYTMLYLSKPQSAPFIFGALVFIFQISLVLMVLFDTIDFYAEDNSWKIPPNVEAPVHIAQALILVFTVAFQQDFVEAVVKWHRGPHPDLINNPTSGASRCSFYLTTVLQATTGVCLLFAIFVLTMQATTVIGMMLNFAALHFLSEIDDLSFQLGSNGFVLMAVEQEATRISETEVRTRPKGNMLFQRLIFFLVVTLLGAGYVSVKMEQAKGAHLCDSVYVQFGDAFNPQLPHLSGIYKPRDEYTLRRREYVDVVTGSSVVLRYCNYEEKWAFLPDNGDETCVNALAMSSQTREYDVLSLGDGWTVRNAKTDTFVPFDYFKLVCADDDDEIETGSSGLLNVFESPCEAIQLDGRTESLPRVDAFALATSFELEKDDNGELRTEYGFPVYFSDDVYPRNYMFFTGRRWFFTKDIYFGFNQTIGEVQRMLLEGDFPVEPIYVSDVVDYSTSEFRSSPVGLSWYQVDAMRINGNSYYGVDAGQAKPSSQFLCVECQSNSTCLNGGTCNLDTQRCECTDEFTSGLCEQYVQCYDQYSPCFDVGICDETGGQCRCQGHSYGQLCEYNYYCFEEGGLCYNGGQCDVDPSSDNFAFCSCSDPATFGWFCEIHNDCTVSGCSNGGVCGAPSYGVCDCPAGYSGVLCDISEDAACDDLLCRSSTVCSSDTNACVPIADDPVSYDCASDFNCFGCSSDEDCHNGGTCSQYGWCECNSLYYKGNNCGFLSTATLALV